MTMRFLDDKDLLTTWEMAEALGVCVSTLRRMVKQDVVPVQERGTDGQLKWRKEDLGKLKKLVGPDLPHPNAARFDVLADEILAVLTTAEADPTERSLLVSYAQELAKDLGAGLRKIEEADPTWFGWASLPPPPGSRFPLQ